MDDKLGRSLRDSMISYNISDQIELELKVRAFHFRRSGGRLLKATNIEYMVVQRTGRRLRLHSGLEVSRALLNYN
jgi:hypothetical protein